MSDSDSAASEAGLAAVFAHAGVDIPPERLAENYELFASTLALIRQASPPGLGETVPAVGFKASWH
jgi:hypothetical protein